MGCSYKFCSCQEVRASLTEEVIQRGSEERELDELRRSFIEEKGFTTVEMWQCEGCRLYNTTTNVKLHISRTDDKLQITSSWKEQIKEPSLTTFNATLKYLEI